MNNDDDKYAFVDKWRRSRVRAVTKGHLYWTEVDIVDISDLPTANAIRSGLEPFCIKTNYFPCGLAEHVKKVLGGSKLTTAPFLIIAAHGHESDGDISLGSALAPEIAVTQDFSEVMTPGDLAKFIDVTGKVVLNTACGGGEKSLADVFLNRGKAKFYIADELAPFGYTSALFPLLFFYFLTNYPDYSIRQAFDRAKSADSEEFETWQLFEQTFT